MTHAFSLLCGYATDSRGTDRCPSNRPGLPIPAPQFVEMIATCRGLDTQARADALVQLTLKK